MKETIVTAQASRDGLSFLIQIHVEHDKVEELFSEEFYHEVDNAIMQALGY